MNPTSFFSVLVRTVVSVALAARGWVGKGVSSVSRECEIMMSPDRDDHRGHADLGSRRRGRPQSPVIPGRLPITPG
jgi:hypothetical protein